MAKGKEQSPEIRTAPLTEPQKLAMDLFKKYQVPYTESQYGLYQDIFEPMSRQLGGILGSEASGTPFMPTYTPEMQQLSDTLMQQLNQPLTLSEDVWSGIWQKGREKVSSEYAGKRQSASERAAGAGMIGQGPTERYFQDMDIAQAKSIEDMAVDMAIQEWTEKKQAKQLAIENMMSFMPYQAAYRQQPIQNMMNFMGYQPQFDLPLPEQQQYLAMPEEEKSPWGTIGGGLGMLAGGLLAVPTGGLSIPMGAAIGGTLGYGAGSMIP